MVRVIKLAPIKRNNVVHVGVLTTIMMFFINIVIDHNLGFKTTFAGIVATIGVKVVLFVLTIKDFCLGKTGTG